MKRRFHCLNCIQSMSYLPGSTPDFLITIAFYTKKKEKKKKRKNTTNFHNILSQCKRSRIIRDRKNQADFFRCLFVFSTPKRREGGDGVGVRVDGWGNWNGREGDSRLLYRIKVCFRAVSKSNLRWLKHIYPVYHSWNQELHPFKCKTEIHFIKDDKLGLQTRRGLHDRR